MNENQTNVELETEQQVMSPEELEEFVKEHLEKARNQGLMIGAQTMARVILQKIYEFKSKQGKKSYRDLERLVADIQKFCETGVSRKINPDGTTSPIEEDNEDPEQLTIQNY